MFSLPKLLALPASLLAMSLPALAHDGVHIHDPYARIINGMGAVYFMIESMETTADVLLSASSPDAGMVQLMNSSADANGVMKMRDVPDGYTVRPGEMYVLAGGADHVMLMDMTRKFVDGDTVTLILTFQKAGEVTVKVPVDNKRFSEPSMGPTGFDADSKDILAPTPDVTALRGHLPEAPMTPFHQIPTALSQAECDALVALCAAAPKKDAGLVGATTAHQIRRADLVWLDDLPQASWVMDRMLGLVAAANRDSFGFELTEFAESPQVARYGAERQGHFDWHSDIGAGTLAAKRKLTVVVQLSDPDDYTGGTLELRPDSHVRQVPRERGLAVVFPSFILHRVTPVEIGTRWSLTLWSHGPAFR